MDATIQMILLAVVVIALYVAIRAARAVSRVGVARFTRALGGLFASVAAAVTKLVLGGAGKASPSRSKPLDLSGTGGRYNARTGNVDNGQDPYGIYPDDDRRL